ncbi:hypothetical protein DL96DRAFT_1574225 [Flagelloscypha sp. PMI_526]|nr:hypothetical protein DL96DRAFT_1574225 [Flagelloscypha sp. PMI_526]
MSLDVVYPIYPAQTKMSIPNSFSATVSSAFTLLQQPPPPSLREIVSAYRARKETEEDRELLLAMLNAKCAEDQRISNIATLHQTMLEMHTKPYQPSVPVSSRSPSPKMSRKRSNSGNGNPPSKRMRPSSPRPEPSPQSMRSSSWKAPPSPCSEVGSPQPRSMAIDSLLSTSDESDSESTAWSDDSGVVVV